MKKKLLYSLAAVVLLNGVLFVVPEAHAQEPTPAAHNGFFQGLIQFIEQKFGLNNSQVQSAVNEYAQQHKNEVANRKFNPKNMQNLEKKKLDALVKAGKITSDQENAILSELQSVRAKYNPDSLKTLTPDQRKSQMQAMQNELKSWAQSQGIDPKYVVPAFGKGRIGGMKGGQGWGNGKWQSVTPTPSQ